MDNIKRIDWIDALRGFAIILVLIGHIPGIPDWLFKWIYSFHIPLFFVISGFLYNKEKWNSLGFKKYVISRIKLYIIPFIILSLSIFVIEILKLLIFSNVIYWEEFYKYVFDYLKWILFQIDGDFCGSWIAGLWFLPTLFFSSIIMYFVNKSRLTKIIYSLTASLIIVLIKYFSIISMPWHLDVALLGCIYMCIGNCINKSNYLNVFNNYILIIIIFILSNIIIFINTLTDLKKHIYGNYLLMIIGASLICFVLLWIFNKFNIKNKTLISYGKNSILIIAFNFIVNYSIKKLSSFFNINLNLFIYFIIECFVIFVIIYLFNVIKARFVTKSVSN